MKTVIMVAEKPSLAQSIATILSNKKSDHRKGFNGACSVHEWQGKFPPTSETVRFRMTSVCGHVMFLCSTAPRLVPANQQSARRAAAQS